MAIRRDAPFVPNPLNTHNAQPAMSRVVDHALVVTNYPLVEPHTQDSTHSDEEELSVVSPAVLEQAYGRELADLLVRVRASSRQGVRFALPIEHPIERRVIAGVPASGADDDGNLPRSASLPFAHPNVVGGPMGPFPAPGNMLPQTQPQPQVVRVPEDRRKEPRVRRARVLRTRPTQTVATVYGIIVALVGCYAVSSSWQAVSKSQVSQCRVLFPDDSICLLDPTASAAFTAVQPANAALLPSSAGAEPEQASSSKGFNYPGLVRLQERLRERIVPRSTSGQLAVDLNFAGLTAKDLVVAIEASDFERKLVLCRALEDFSREARGIGQDSQRLSAKVRSAVDTIVAFNDYTLHVMSTAAASTDLAKTSQAVAIIPLLSVDIKQILTDADAVAASLDMLDGYLFTIASIWDHESRAAGVAAEQLSSQLWSMLGGNKAARQRLAYHQDLLRNLDEYRSALAAYLAATSEALLTLTADLLELGKKLDTTRVGDGGMPLEVVVRSVERGARRLVEERLGM
ncbi:hypothetical protein C8Q76DRAFT_789379 [Earliella scabrosa]|nr:hypothetical protein C8Q76DRAFT_789379 [Earliella scabrosa]